MTKVIGIDPSLTSTGVASPLGWTEAIKTKKLRGLPRLRHILNELRTYTLGSTLAVIEGPSYGHSGMRQHEELVALRWMIYDLLDRADIPYVLVPPSSLKLWATGKGNASKEDVAAAMDRRHDDGEFLAKKRFDEADALALAEMGAGWLNNWCLSPERQRAMAAVAWPELEVAQ
jgi:crossover junction endodeoxyribonuclease RuvC